VLYAPTKRGHLSHLKLLLSVRAPVHRGLLFVFHIQLPVKMRQSSDGCLPDKYLILFYFLFHVDIHSILLLSSCSLLVFKLFFNSTTGQSGYNSSLEDKDKNYNWNRNNDRCC